VLCVLLVRFSSIGDILLTTPLIRAIARRHPDAKLVYVTQRAMAPLVADHPALAHVVALDPEEPLLAVAPRLRRLSPTLGLDLHGTWRSALLRLAVPCRWSGFGKRPLARAVLISTKADWYRRPLAVAERYFAAARRLDVRPDGGPPEFFLGQGARDRVADWAGQHGLGRGGAPIAALAPGAAHATKRWPLPHWIALADRLRTAGYDRVVVGGPDDRGLAGQLVAAGVAKSGAGELSLQETGALLARARVVVSGDTGVAHMATGVGTPVVALFGPTVEQFGFFPYRAPAVVLQRALGCRPCSATGTAACPLGHHRCLADVAPADVAQAVTRLVA
jgi:lipopolysaccharide heptosyltransferase II